MCSVTLALNEPHAVATAKTAEEPTSCEPWAPRQFQDVGIRSIHVLNSTEAGTSWEWRRAGRGGPSPHCFRLCVPIHGRSACLARKVRKCGFLERLTSQIANRGECALQTLRRPHRESFHQGLNERKRPVNRFDNVPQRNLFRLTCQGKAAFRAANGIQNAVTGQGSKNLEQIPWRHPAFLWRASRLRPAHSPGTWSIAAGR